MLIPGFCWRTKLMLPTGRSCKWRMINFANLHSFVDALATRLMNEDGLERIYKNWDLADDVPSVVALGVVPRQPVVEEVVEEGRASLLAEPGIKSPLKQNPTGKYQSSLKHSRIWSNEEIKASIWILYHQASDSHFDTAFKRSFSSNISVLNLNVNLFSPVSLQDAVRLWLVQGSRWRPPVELEIQKIKYHKELT